jgi:hypothetical protein
VTLGQLREAPATRAGFPCFELPEWRSQFNLTAGVMARGADFGLGSLEPTAAVLDRWRKLRSGLRPAFGALVTGHQCHGTTLAVHRSPAAGWHILDDTDGHFT